MSPATGRSRVERGQALIFVTLSLVATFGVLGLVVDLGWAHWRREAARTAAQSAVGAAAVAASAATGFSSTNCMNSENTVYPCRTDWVCPASPANPPGDSLEAGCLYAKKNGFSNANPRQHVVVSSGTSGSPLAGTYPAYWIRVTVSETNPQLFSAVLGHAWGTVRARSTAGVYLDPLGACIYALNRTASPAIDVTGSANVSASCGLYDNSSAAGALDIKGGANMTVGSASVVGGIVDNGGGGSLSINPNANPPGEIKTGVDPTPDPFGSVPDPTYPSGQCDSNGINGGSHIVMPSSGIFVVCGNISLNGNATQSFPPGLYIVKGGISWNNGTIEGAGVTFYLTSANYSGISILGNVHVNLSAPSSGTYRGIIFFQDRSLVNPPAASFTGGEYQILDGSLYFPGSNVTYMGGSSTTASYTGIVADTVSFKGNSVLTADTNGQHTGLGLPKVGVME